MANQLTNLTNFADQLIGFQLADGSSGTLELIFQGATERWCFIVKYAAFNSGLLGLCCYPNILRQWEDTLPFGIACVTADQTDPFNVNDFATGRVSLYILEQADIATLNSLVFGGPQL